MLHPRLVEPLGSRQAEAHAPCLVRISRHLGGKPLELGRLQGRIFIGQRIATHEILARDEIARRTHLIDHAGKRDHGLLRLVRGRLFEQAGDGDDLSGKIAAVEHHRDQRRGRAAGAVVISELPRLVRRAPGNVEPHHVGELPGERCVGVALE